MYGRRTLALSAPLSLERGEEGAEEGWAEEGTERTRRRTRKERRVVVARDMTALWMGLGTG